MKRTILLTAIALLISAGITAQSTNQTQNQNQNQNQTQSQTGDQSQLQTRKRDQLRIHDQTGTRNTQVCSQSASQARRMQVGDGGAHVNVMNHNMRMSTMSGARRR
jgi:hypothetical protein